MNDVEMPALTGDSPLGILAAMGVLRLLSDFTEDQPRLRWNPKTLVAVLSTRHENLDGVVTALSGIVAAMPNGAVLPGVVAGFPPGAAGKDGLRVSPAELRIVYEAMTASMKDDQCEEVRRWLASIVTDLATKTGQKTKKVKATIVAGPDADVVETPLIIAEKAGDVAMEVAGTDVDGGQDADQKTKKVKVATSQYIAFASSQTMVSMFRKSLAYVRANPDYLRQALVGWRRVAGVTGEGLDHRAMWSAAEDGGGGFRPDGPEPLGRGVPGATWLALMSYPLLRTTAVTRDRACSSGWHVVTVRGLQTDELRLPVWQQPLTCAAISALIEHIALRTDKGGTGLSGSPAELRALGVLRVCRARRRREEKWDGPLVPTET